ncbi:Glycosyltransferase, catalytic subunit of cellulose synthase and poly-beta-1,6-N-acetylglucosamine synthase [Pustulibacterium marinum]|uniref:Glycosyltransferase, catalytic subunit of cellulose synthase and poly-beta-1,6-N-acetylglucosamine synthase n=1 Tax=Pustulibacterium marinum TaxID=1224947 RepID=A0A1I7HNM0_9FLAO|nr:glycosyltransferase [Pustulibacterium marinum]SFU62364.1 Glycosyltransferase, catalytic subunit of cellulose synthase and poly-beta-1,6-N-acetylglucosamine synthase [Pustulibacterium marinum]
MVTVLFILFIAVVCVQAIYYLGIFSNFAFSKKKSNTYNTTETIPVSVLVCAKNEADNLRQNLPKLLAQRYPNFQLVLINDASYDETLDVMEEFAAMHDNIKIVNVENNEAFWGKKKYALVLGIKAAKYNHMLFIDADCYPSSEFWIKEMASNFNKEKTIVLGYGGYKKIKNSLANALTRFETVFAAMQYFSFAKIGMPYMGVGRNLAYHKNEFNKTSGFISHMHIRSGDDDLFVNEAATAKNTSICFNEEAFTYSTSKKSLKAWFTQKRRHVSTASHYKKSHQVILGLFYISQFFFWLLAILLLSFQHQLIITGALIGFRMLMQYFVFGFTASKLKETKLLWLLPFYEIFLIILQFCIFIVNFTSKPVDWK